MNRTRTLRVAAAAAALARPAAGQLNDPFPAAFDLLTLTGSTGRVVFGAGAFSEIGRAVASAGDVNGDGIDDLVIGGYIDETPGGVGAGLAYVVFGSPAGSPGFATLLEPASLDGTNGFVIAGVAENDQLGSAVASAGDVNGDGVDDILVGARGADPNGNGLAGACYVVFGRDTAAAGAFAPLVDAGLLDGTDGFAINGIDPTDLAGAAVAPAGDVNGDGVDDLLIGAFGGDPGGSGSAGECYVVFGSDAGPGAFPAELNLSVLAVTGGNLGFVINGIDAGDESGRAVAGAGDINGDGVGDILIGAPGAAPGGNADAGESYVVFGRDAASAGGFGPSFDLASLDGTNGFIISGIDPDDESGWSVAGAGDVNGDGIDDVAIGSNLGDIFAFFEGGESYVVFGRDTASAGGFPASLDLASLDGTNGFLVTGVPVFGAAGTAVSAAGDVDGDGVDDLLIGAAWDEELAFGSSGAAYVVYGRDTASAGGFGPSLDLATLDGTNGFTLNGRDPGDQCGWSVAAAGDANGDGNADLIVGANAADPNGVDAGGEAYLVFGRRRLGVPTVELASLDGSAGFVINGAAAGDQSGAVAPAGDINGDGIDDIVIGARDADPNGVSRAGESYVVFGRDTAAGGGFGSTLELSTLDGTNGFTLEGVGTVDLSGSAVASAGDVNHDGVDDLLIGAFAANAGGINSGEAYIVFGRDTATAGGFPAAVGLASLDGTDGFTLLGIDPNDFAGIAVAPAGDVNGDGVDDIIVGARDADPNGAESGESYVVFGRDTASAGGFPASLDLASLDGTNGFVLNGVAAEDRSGIAVSRAGDFNGDGLDDLLIGAISAEGGSGSTDPGHTYMVYGRDTAAAGPFAASLELADLDGDDGFRFVGRDTDDGSGFSVAAAGDINGDGIDDILISAPGGDPNGADNAGEVYAVFGSDTASFGPSFQLSILDFLDGDFGFTINGIDAGDDTGRSIAGAGDVNGDGIDDIVIGAQSADPGARDSAGETYVIFGRDTTAGGDFEATLDLAELDETTGFRIAGIDAGDLSGGSVASAGDINGDGVDDILIGARFGDPSGNADAGETYVVFGVDTTPDPPCTVDVNMDGVVDGGDFFAWVAAFGSQGPGCDQNNDGLCNAGDFFAFVAAFGAGCP